jgi:hypothetical protein
MRRILIVMLMVGMLHFGSRAYPQDTRSPSEGRRLHRVSLIRVIANLSEFDGEQVQVVGCLGGAGLDDGPGVFVSESDALNGVLSNAVDLRVHDSNTIRGMYGKYVIISGLYHAPPPGGDFNGYIDNIVVLRLLKAGNTSK